MSEFEHFIDGGNGEPKRYVLIGDKGAIQFLYIEANEYCCAKALDLGYHSPCPVYSDHEPVANDCKFVKGGVCYYDGSTLAAERPLEILLQFGEDLLWKFLELRYHAQFDEE